MRRPNQHLFQFSMIELGTTGNFDADSRLSIKGRFSANQLETVLKSYIAEYVKCSGCGSNFTNFDKGNRITFIQCCTCGATRAIAPIKLGFVAVTSRERIDRKSVV